MVDTMPAPKIPNTSELASWMRDGKSNAQCLALMAERYRLAGDELPTTAALSKFRSRRGLPVTVHPHRALVPWTVKAEHGSLWPAKMLRAESNRRLGNPLPATVKRRLDAWLKRLSDEGLVVHYDAETPDGFAYVPARPGVDTDLIRVPSPDV